MPTYLDPLNGISLSAAIAESAVSARVDRIRLTCYELWHASRTEPLRVVADTEPLTATLEASAPRNPSESVVFMASGVTYDVPEESTDAASAEINLRIDNVSGHVYDMFAAAEVSSDPAIRDSLWELIERVYASDDTSAPAVIPVFKTTPVRVSMNGATAIITCRARNPANRAIPAISFTPESYPGLV